jgi:hypothetical protein
VTVFAAGVEFEASLTSEAARTPSDSVATIARAAIGAFRLGGGPRRVRAAAPQRRHQSCFSASGAPQIGQLSLEATGAAAPAPADCAERPPDTGATRSGGAPLTRLQVAGGRESCLERTSWFPEGRDRRAGVESPTAPDGCTRQGNDAGSK